MLYNILAFLSFLQSIIGFILMSSSAMRFKKPVKKRRIIAFLLMFIIMIAYLLALRFLGIEKMEKLAILVIVFTFLLWYIICSSEKLFPSFFNFLTFINIYIAISFFSDKLANSPNPILNILKYILIRGVIYTVVVLLLYKFVKKPVLRLIDLLNKEWRSATLVPFIFIVLQVALLYYPIPYWRWEENSWYRTITVIVYLLFMAVYYLLYIQANAIIEKYSIEKRQILMAQQNKLWEFELNRQKIDLAVASQKRHDIHHHNAAILGMIKNGDLSSLETYIKSYDELLEIHHGKTFCSHSIINSLLNTYEKKANDKFIKTEFKAVVPEKIGIDNIDLVCVLGNALENAFEGCMRMDKEKEKEIFFFAKYSNNRLCVRVENTCLNNIEFNEEMPISQKKDGGTGTKSIIYAAELYDGTASFSISNGKFMMQLVLNSK